MLDFLFAINWMPHILTVNGHLILRFGLLFQIQRRKNIYHLISAGLNQDVWRFQLSKLFRDLIHCVQHCSYWSWDDLSCVVSLIGPNVLVHVVFITVGEFWLYQLEGWKEVPNGLSKLFHYWKGFGNLSQGWCKKRNIIVLWWVSYCNLKTYCSTKT